MWNDNRTGTGELTLKPTLAIRALILLGATPVSVAFSTVSPVLPKLSAALAHNAADAYLVKMLVGIVGISMVTGGPVLGALFDRMPRRPFLVGAALSFAAFGVAPYFVADLAAMLINRFLMAIAAIALCVSAAAMVGDCFLPEERSQWMGLYEAVAMFGGVVTLFLAGWLGDFGWQQPFCCI